MVKLHVITLMAEFSVTFAKKISKLLAEGAVREGGDIELFIH